MEIVSEHWKTPLPSLCQLFIPWFMFIQHRKLGKFSYAIYMKLLGKLKQIKVIQWQFNWKKHTLGMLGSFNQHLPLILSNLPWTCWSSVSSNLILRGTDLTDKYAPLDHLNLFPAGEFGDFHICVQEKLWGCAVHNNIKLMGLIQLNIYEIKK